MLLAGASGGDATWAGAARGATGAGAGAASGAAGAGRIPRISVSDPLRLPNTI